MVKGREMSGEREAGSGRRARIAVTKRTLDALPTPAEDAVYWDRDTKRFGVRLTPAGAVSFIVQYRNAQGRSRRLTIGSYGTWTPVQARDEAERLLRMVDAGGDPVQSRRDERNAITFRQLASEYIDKSERGLIITRKGRPKRPGTVEIDKYRMSHLTSHFGDEAVKNITRGDCQRCLEKLIAGKHGAARTMGLLGAMFSYAIDQHYIAATPIRGIRMPADGRREFRLDEAGYRALGESLEAAEACGESWQAVAAVRLIALTGCRKGEVLGLKRTEIDFSARCLRLENPKSGPVRPMGEPVVRLLNALLARRGRPESPYVLPGPYDPRKPFNGLGGASEGAWGRIVGAGYTPHSLRHAFASIAGDLGYSELAIGALIGNGSGSVTAGYVHLDKVLVAAADRVSRWIWSAMDGTSQAARIDAESDIGGARANRR